MSKPGQLGVISAYLDGKKSINKQRHGQLIVDLQKLGYRKVSDFKGSWEGKKEHSVVVENIRHEDLFELGRKYGQESVIFKAKTGVVGMYYFRTMDAQVAVDPKSGGPAFETALGRAGISKERNWSFSFDFLEGRIPWDGHSVITHDDIAKHLGLQLAR